MARRRVTGPAASAFDPRDWGVEDPSDHRAIHAAAVAWARLTTGNDQPGHAAWAAYWPWVAEAVKAEVLGRLDEV